MRSASKRGSVINTECVSFARDCQAVVIPAGELVVIPQGTVAALTQALGDSFTVYINGNLLRIDGKDADAIGKELVKPPELPPDATDEEVEQLIWGQMKTCYDPEIPVNIVELGLVYECQVEHVVKDKRKVRIQMTLTAPGCGMGDILVNDVASKLKLVPTIEDVSVELVFEPPWDFHMMSYEAKLETGML